MLIMKLVQIEGACFELGVIKHVDGCSNRYTMNDLSMSTSHAPTLSSITPNPIAMFPTKNNTFYISPKP
ncbi:hypothetical protein QVD17_01748 [Tagetes erecta]|uniref:Uncharacterized protein n=1 Tax=Tagetes erecta TaxID=13708 RepID=A0AAD8P1S2_TARER|nr:hypothetical protein QVD17_01748 [Tagetes erecta]